MTPAELFRSGALDEAVSAAIGDVKSKPTDIARRVFLSELMCFTGDIERADIQLATALTQQPDLMFVLQFRQLIRAEKARQEFYTAGRIPEFLFEPTACVKQQLEASILIRENKHSEARALLDAAANDTPEFAGTSGGKEFRGLRDLDDLLIGVLEVLTSNGNYYWVSFDSIATVEFRKPERTRDLIWRSAHVTIPDGPDGEVYIPALYFGSHLEEDDNLRLGRSTDWRAAHDGPVRGLGQRILLVGEQEEPVLELSQIEFQVSQPGLTSEE